jgi:uncharacterized protein YjbI with pentapeptide repeats
MTRDEAEAVIQAARDRGEVANLRSACLRNADFQGIDFQSVDLCGADLRDADLRRSDLRSADLRSADLAGADLQCADITGACLRRANLSRADIEGADISHADLSYADLSYADLRNASTHGVNLWRTKLHDAISLKDSHEALAEIARQHDEVLLPVAAMIRGRIIGCWPEYTQMIRYVFGEDIMRALANAWLQCESWGIRARLERYSWPMSVQKQNDTSHSHTTI